MTPSSRIGSFAWAAAAGLFLLAPGRSSVSATAASPQAGSELLPPLYEPPALAPAVGTPHLRSSDAAAFGQVDVFIDLACPKSAAAWPTLKRIVKDQRHRVDFVFHILPLSECPIGYFAAKAVQVILANSDGTYDDVERFIDWVFRGQRIVLYEQDMDMSLDAREIVSDWALSTSRLSPEKLYSDMIDPAFDEKVLNDLENRFLTVAIASTPTVLINGIFMMHLEGDRQLQDFELFLVGTDFDSSPYEGTIADDVEYTRSSAWEELEQDVRDEYDEMARARKAQQAAREQRKFEQVEQQVQQQLNELDVQQQGQLKHLLHLQQDQLKHLLQQQDQMEADMQGTMGSLPLESSPPSSSSALGFGTPRYSMPHYSTVSSSSSSSSSSSTTSITSSMPPPLPPPLPSPSREEVDEPAVDDIIFEEAMALAAEWAARSDDMERHVMQQTRQQQDVRAGKEYWLSFVRYSDWPRAVAAPSEENVQAGSSGAGGVKQEGQQEGGGEEPGFEQGQEGINFEEYRAAAADVIAVEEA